MAAIDLAKVSELSVKDVAFTESFDEISTLLSAPVTEFAEFKTDSPESFEAVKKVLSNLTSSAPKGATLGAAYGDFVGVENTLLLIVGWPSIEVCSLFKHAQAHIAHHLPITNNMHNRLIPHTLKLTHLKRMQRT